MLAVSSGWRLGFGYLIPLYVAALVALRMTVSARTSGETSAVDRLSLAAVRRRLAGVTRRPVLLCAGTLLTMGFVFQGFTGVYPTYLHETKALAQPTAATLFGLFFAAGMLIQPVTGVVGDRVGLRRTMLLCTALGVLGLIALPAVHGVTALAVLTLVLSAQLGFWPVAQAYIIELLPNDMRGSGFGLLRTVYLLVAAAGPLVVGAFADAGHFDGGFLQKIIGDMLRRTARRVLISAFSLEQPSIRN